MRCYRSSARYVVSAGLFLTLLLFGHSARSAPVPTEMIVHTYINFGPVLDRTVGKIMLERHNTKVIWEEVLNQDAYTKVLTQRSKPEVSVSIVDPVHYLRGVKAELWERLDPNIVTNLAPVYAAARATYPGPYGAPIQANTVGIQYRTDVFLQRGLTPPDGYADLWRPEFKGRVGLTSATSGTGMRMLVIFARMRGGGETNMDPGFTLVKDLVQKQDIRFFATTSANFNSAMQRGEIWVGVQFTQGALRFKAEGAPVNHVYPEEGVSLSVSGAVVVKGAPHQELAQRFVNLLLERDFQTEMARTLWAVPVRPGITLPPLYARTLPLSPEQWSKMVNHNWELITAKTDEWNQRWLREVERR